MALSNVAAWNDEKAASACGSACAKCGRRSAQYALLFLDI